MIPENTLLESVTHVGGFLVVVDLVDSSGQAKVSDLHHVVLRHQNVSGCQISVDALQRGERELKTDTNPEVILRPTASRLQD